MMLSPAAAKLAIDAVTTLIDEGSAPSALMIWSGPMPADTETSIDPGLSSLLASFELADPSFGEAALNGDYVEGVMADVAIAVASADGEASFYRVYNGEGDTVMQGEVTDDPLDGDPEKARVNQITITSGSDVSITGAVILKMAIR